MRRLLFGLAAAVLVGVLVAMPAGGAVGVTQVVVSDAAVTPKTAHAKVGGTVEWRNVGRRPHRLRSLTNAWPGFTLAPGKRYRLTFARAGRYPYRIDGTRPATIVVAGGGSSGGSSGIPSLPGERQVSFEVRIAIDAFSQVRTPLGSVGTEVRNRTVHWTGIWPKITLRVLAGPDGKLIAVLPVKPYPFAGTIKAWGKFSYHDPPAYNGVNCQGPISTQTYSAPLLVTVSPPTGGLPIGVDFESNPNDAGKAWVDTVDKKEKARCSGHVAIIGGTQFDITTKDGIPLSPDAELLRLSWKREGPITKPPFPIGRLIAGRSFTINTGTRVKTDVRDVVDKEKVVVTFKARRP